MREYLKLSCEDNMDLMARYEDNHFDLAIVDPPYGIGEGGDKIKSRHHSQKKYHTSDWDNKAPDIYYFKEIIRVSKNQIIWGANHFIQNIPNSNSPCWIIWDKDTGNCDFADGELAYTSFKTAVRKFDFTWNGFRQGYDYKNKENRIHPTQKPVALYQWLLKNYAKEGDKILDTHLGSMSIAIAVDSVNKIEGMNLTLTGCELDPEYYEKGIERVERETKWESVFKEQPLEVEQTKMF